MKMIVGKAAYEFRRLYSFGRGLGGMYPLIRRLHEGIEMADQRPHLMLVEEARKVGVIWNTHVGGARLCRRCHQELQAHLLGFI